MEPPCRYAFHCMNTFQRNCKENLYWKDYGLLLNTIDDIKLWSLET